MKGYKVVLVRSQNTPEHPKTFKDHYYSSCQGGKSMVEYLMGQPVHPKRQYGPLAEFKTFEDAKDFIEILDLVGHRNRIIFTCEYESSSDKKLWDEWRENLKLIVKGHAYPQGTAFASSVTILRRVE